MNDSTAILMKVGELRTQLDELAYIIKRQQQDLAALTSIKRISEQRRAALAEVWSTNNDGGWEPSFAMHVEQLIALPADGPARSDAPAA